MKIVQNETGEKGKQQQVGEKRKAKTLKNKILQNVGQSDVSLPPPSSSSLLSTVMTDELKSNNSKKNANNNNSSDENGSLNSKQIDSINITSVDGSHNTNSSELIIAEAAKILLKNGLNGSNAAAAAAVATATATLLTAAANFQLPKPPSPLQSRSSAVQTANATTAAAAHAQLVAIAAAAAAVNATTKHNRLCTSSASGHQSVPSTTPSAPNLTLNNGSLDSTVASNSINVSSSSSVKHQFAKPIETLVTTSMYSLDMGVIDYTINSSPANATVTTVVSSVETPSSSSIINLSSANLSSIGAQQHHKYSINSSHNKNNNNSLTNQHSRCDIGRLPISNTQSSTGTINVASNSISYHHNNTHNVTRSSNQIYGGRLQFFKDGKFILELARSKDGDKSGWVSVPREDNPVPSAARSSTITPSASFTGAAQTLLAASPAALPGSMGFPKNECSNSLSFSDDNSSIQSSPWQRDHCWKQVTPKKNISKEMSLFYQRPAFKQLTAQSLCRARKKRRKPYDLTVTMNISIFAEKAKEVFEREELTDKNSIEKESNSHGDGDSRQLVDDDIQKCLTAGRLDSDIGANESEVDVMKEKNLDVVDTKNNENSISRDHVNDMDMTKVSNLDGNEVSAERMNISECGGSQTVEEKLTLNGNDGIMNKESKKKKNEHEAKTLTDSKKNDKVNIATLTGKRLKKLKYKSRAKLTTIVQKLADASASRLASNVLLMSKASITLPSIVSTTTSSSISNIQQNLGHKVSPPSSSAASRLVEHHQQHVSPRKRILREFEKVSLEDSAVVAGGKRSRAKNNNSMNSGSAHSFTQTTVNSTTSLHNTKSVVTTSGHTENAQSSSTVMSATLTAVNTSKNSMGTPTAPTKLYSSYSIHSLLGGSSDSSSIKKADVPAPNPNSVTAYHQTSAHIHNSSMGLPKSPETNCGGKSPSNILSKTKRSPPYAPSIHDTHSRSPSISGGYTEYGRRSPWNSPDVAHNNFHKLRYTGSSSESSSPTHNQHNNPHHHLQQHQQQHYLHHNPLVAHQQTYYSPYMMSPHYVPAPPTISPTNSAATNNHNNLVATMATTINVGVMTNSRSPHHHSSAFRAATPTSSSSTTTITTASTMHIPAQKELSPTRSMTASPRETAPRTVPKKTASIRRQFASPTAATGSSGTNCSSPNADNRSNSHDEINSNNGRRTPVASIQQQTQQQHLMQRNSPGAAGSVAASVLHSYPYIYPPPPLGSPHNSATANTLMPSTPGASQYIPAVVGSPYYHPYISTLAAMRHPQMWMQHYQNTAAVAAAPSLLPVRHPAALSSSRLSPPYHGFQYNGVGNAAALAAAVAAAAGFGSGGGHQSTIPQSALSQCSMFAHIGSASLDGNSLAAITNTHSSLSAGLRVASAMPITPMTDNTTADLTKTSKDGSHSLISVSSSASVSTSSSSSTTIYPISSSKDEQSSDVPLNLSKH